MWQWGDSRGSLPAKSDILKSRGLHIRQHLQREFLTSTPTKRKTQVINKRKGDIWWIQDSRQAYTVSEDNSDSTVDGRPQTCTFLILHIHIVCRSYWFLQFLIINTGPELTHDVNQNAKVIFFYTTATTLQLDLRTHTHSQT